MAAWQRQLPHGVKVGKVGTMLSGPSEVVHGNIVLEYVGGSIFPAGWWRAVEQRVGTRCEDGVPSPCSSPGWLPLSADGQCRWTILMDLPLCPAMSRVRLCHVCWEWLCSQFVCCRSNAPLDSQGFWSSSSALVDFMGWSIHLRKVAPRSFHASRSCARYK